MKDLFNLLAAAEQLFERSFSLVLTGYIAVGAIYLEERTSPSSSQIPPRRLRQEDAAFRAVLQIPPYRGEC